jgi:hypothetical protein
MRFHLQRFVMQLLRRDHNECFRNLLMSRAYIFFFIFRFLTRLEQACMDTRNLSVPLLLDEKRTEVKKNIFIQE